VRGQKFRRRRAVLAVLVGLSLIPLTAYLGEPSTSPLHTLQRGIVDVLSPIRQGASKVFSPVRDVAGWFSDAIQAKSRVDQLQKKVDRLQAELGEAEAAQTLNRQLRRDLGARQERQHRLLLTSNGGRDLAGPDLVVSAGRGRQGLG
jgi:rod shape-determining protein MreC